jgi:hypothetical protein
MRKVILLFACVSLVLATGCKSKDQPAPAARDEFNRERFGSAPAAVAEGFARDYPNTTVTNVVVYMKDSARPVYRVDYIRDKKVRMATYSQTGQRFSPPVPPVVN